MAEPILLLPAPTSVVTRCRCSFCYSSPERVLARERNRRSRLRRKNRRKVRRPARIVTDAEIIRAAIRVTKARDDLSNAVLELYRVARSVNAPPTLHFPLRRDLAVDLHLPTDLTRREQERLVLAVATCFVSDGQSLCLDDQFKAWSSTAFPTSKSQVNED